MPLPIILGGIAAVAGATGVGSIAHGGRKMKKANDTMKKAKEKQESAVQLYNEKNGTGTYQVYPDGWYRKTRIRNYEQL